MNHKTLVCVVEGHGDVTAIPKLCYRVLEYLGITGWRVNFDSIRHPKSRIVLKGASHGSPNRESIEKLIQIAIARSAHSLAILLDADDDCPARFGPAATAMIRERMSGFAVMAEREFESWVLLSIAGDDEVERFRNLRGAKEELVRREGDYKPRIHQVKYVDRIDINRVRDRSPSFDKFVRDLLNACGS